MERQIHAHRGREITRPHATANHDVSRADLSLSRPDTGHLITITENRLHLGASENLCAAALRPLGQRLSDIHGIGVPVGGNVDPSIEVVGLNQRILFRDLTGR